MDPGPMRTGPIAPLGARGYYWHTGSRKAVRCQTEKGTEEGFDEVVFAFDLDIHNAIHHRDA